jgi:CRP-like cAMP-binding protein
LESLIKHIANIYKLPQESLDALADNFKKLELSKGDYLVNQGSVCRNLYFLERGCVRGFYLLEEKEVTYWFAFENDFLTSFHSFITKTPSVEKLQTLEDSVLWSISHDALFALYDKYPSIERLGRIVCEQYYIRLDERYIKAQFKAAPERYQDLITNHPHILQRVSLGYVASFLGISQETLSRIRSKKM